MQTKTILFWTFQSGSVGIQFSDIGLLPNTDTRRELALTTHLETSLSRVSIASDHTQLQLEHLANAPGDQLTSDEEPESEEEDEEEAKSSTLVDLNAIEMTCEHHPHKIPDIMACYIPFLSEIRSLVIPWVIWGIVLPDIAFLVTCPAEHVLLECYR